MKFGSVCSGIEAASATWYSLGWEPAWLSEVDVQASTVLAHRLGATSPRFPLLGTEKAIAKIQWGDRIVNWGDMTRLPNLVRSGEAEAPDVFCGGTPCQAFSIAGRREGLNDDRGNLTLTFVEIANEIDLKRAADGDEPCIIFWENVPGVLSDKTNAFGCFLAGLAGESVPLEPSGKRWADAGCVIGPQRTVAWRKFDAQYFGLAQRRERVFVVASAREGFDPVEILFEFDGVRRDSAPSREAGEETAGTLDARTSGGGFPGTDGACANHVVPAERPVGSVGLEPQWWDGSPVSQTLDAVLHKGQTMPEKNRFPAVLQPIPILEAGARTGKSTTDPRAGIGIGNEGDPMYTLQSGKQHAVAFVQNSRDEVRLMGGDGEIVGALAANTGAKQQCYIAFSCKDYGADATEDLAPTMRAMGHKDSHPNAGGQLAIAFAPQAGGKQTTLGFDEKNATSQTLGSNQQIAVATFANAGHFGSLKEIDKSDPLRAKGGDTGPGGESIVVCVTGDRTHALNTANNGKGCGEDGTGRGVPTVAVALRGREGGGTIEMGDEVQGTLRASGGGGDKPHVFTEMAVRRLMPVECERLQGFFDDWTTVPTTLVSKANQKKARAAMEAGDTSFVDVDGEIRKVASDGARYKQLGNSWPVPVVYWIGARIEARVRALDSRTISATFDARTIAWLTAA